uniref:Uncharacterized protein n=1 Tax=Anguilla anguilla TaxID=7936 RepID=A0A0E9U2V1_ANGAN
MTSSGIPEVFESESQDQDKDPFQISAWNRLLTMLRIKP